MVQLSMASASTKPGCAIRTGYSSPMSAVNFNWNAPPHWRGRLLMLPLLPHPCPGPHRSPLEGLLPYPRSLRRQPQLWLLRHSRLRILSLFSTSSDLFPGSAELLAWRWLRSLGGKCCMAARQTRAAPSPPALHLSIPRRPERLSLTTRLLHWSPNPLRSRFPPLIPRPEQNPNHPVFR